MPKTVSEKIVAAEELIAEKKSAITALLTTAETENRDIDDEEQVQIDEHADYIETAQKSLESLKRAEKALALRQVSVDDARESRQRAPATAKSEVPGSLIFKLAAVSIIAHQTKSSLDAVAKKYYSADDRVGAIVKSQVDPADTMTPGWAAELVGNSITGFMEELRAASIYSQLASIGTSINFGNSGSVTIPGWSGSGTDLAGSFVAENAPIPVKRGTLSSQSLNRYKMAVISTFSKELARSSTPQIEGLIRTKIVNDTAQALDVALLDSAASVPGVRPASIIYGAPSQASAGGDVAGVTADMKFLLGTLAAANAGRSPVLITHPSNVLALSLITNAAGQFVFRADVNSGNLFGARLVTSTYVPSDILVLLDGADFATAFGTPEFEASDVATIVEGNDDGTDPQVLPVGEAATAGAPTIRSLFQTWSTGLRMVMPLSWAMMRTNTIAVVTDVDY